MANLIQCDRCGAVHPCQDAYFIMCYRYCEPGKGSYENCMDICVDCHEELAEECEGALAGLEETADDVPDEESEEEYGQIPDV